MEHLIDHLKWLIALPHLVPRGLKTVAFLYIFGQKQKNKNKGDESAGLSGTRDQSSGPSCPHPPSSSSFSPWPAAPALRAQTPGGTSGSTGGLGPHPEPVCPSVSGRVRSRSQAPGVQPRPRPPLLKSLSGKPAQYITWLCLHLLAVWTG